MSIQNTRLPWTWKEWMSFVGTQQRRVQGRAQSWCHYGSLFDDYPHAEVRLMEWTPRLRLELNGLAASTDGHLDLFRISWSGSRPNDSKDIAIFTTASMWLLDRDNSLCEIRVIPLLDIPALGRSVQDVITGPQFLDAFFDYVRELYFKLHRLPRAPTVDAFLPFIDPEIAMPDKIRPRLEGYEGAQYSIYTQANNWPGWALTQMLPECLQAWWKEAQPWLLKSRWPISAPVKWDSFIEDNPSARFEVGYQVTSNRGVRLRNIRAGDIVTHAWTSVGPGSVTCKLVNFRRPLSSAIVTSIFQNIVPLIRDCTDDRVVLLRELKLPKDFMSMLFLLSFYEEDEVVRDYAMSHLPQRWQTVSRADRKAFLLALLLSNEAQARMLSEAECPSPLELHCWEDGQGYTKLLHLPLPWLEMGDALLKEIKESLMPYNPENLNPRR